MFFCRKAGLNPQEFLIRTLLSDIIGCPRSLLFEAICGHCEIIQCCLATKMQVLTRFFTWAHLESNIPLKKETWHHLYKVSLEDLICVCLKDRAKFHSRLELKNIQLFNQELHDVICLSTQSHSSPT